MLKIIDNDTINIKDVCSHDVYGTRIYAYYLTYGNKFDFFKAWVQTDESGKITAAVCLIDGSMTLTCTDDADFEELAAFIGMMGFDSLQCDREKAKRLGLCEDLWGYVVRYRRNENPKKAFGNTVFGFDGDLSKIYSLIKSANLIGVGDYLPWLSDVSYRIKKDTAKPLCAYDGGRIMSCASALFITDSAALLGAVATDPDYRSMGLAGELVTTLGNEMNSLGKRAELLCKHDSIVEFYHGIGFETAGEWAIIERKEEQGETDLF